MRNCIGRFTYVWLSNGLEFWFFPVQIWANTVVGFRWDRRFGWSYTGISLNRIDMFSCT
ncbi:MAG TPA: transporter, partial [Lachnoclostridium sp.]|nr:transporter [Lachnoclostridium sp.]